MRRALGLILVLLAAPAWGQTEHAVLFFRGAVTLTPAYLSNDVSNIPEQNNFAVPFDGRASNLSVYCSGPLSATRTFTLQVDGADTNLSCPITSGGTACQDFTNHADIVAESRVVLAAMGTGTSANLCWATVTWRKPDNTGATGLLTWGAGGPSTPSDGEFCGPRGVATTNAQKCRETVATAASFVMPVAGTVNSICVSISSPLTGANTETYTVRNVTAAADTDAVVTLLLLDGKSNCFTAGTTAFSAGDLLTVRFNRTGTGDSRFRQITVGIAGTGQVVADRNEQFWNDSDRWGNSHYPFAGTGLSIGTYRMERPGRLQNLRVSSTASPLANFTTIICSGATESLSCTGFHPSCMIDTGSTDCSDTTNTLDLATGDWFTVLATVQGAQDFTKSISVAYEIVDPVAANTPTPTGTPTPGGVLTPTPPNFHADDEFIENFVAKTATRTVSKTPTATITRTPTVTRTPTSFGCHKVAVTGKMYDASGNPAISMRVSIQVPRTEVVNAGCTLQPSIVTYTTTSTGDMPANASVVAGSQINVTLQNGGPVQVCVPRGVDTIDIQDLLESPCQ